MQNSWECLLDKGWVKTSLRDQAYKNCKDVGRIVDDVQVFGNKEKHMTELYEKKQNVLEKKALGIILINIFFSRANVVVLITYNVQKRSNTDMKKEEASIPIQTPRNRQ